MATDEMARLGAALGSGQRVYGVQKLRARPSYAHGLTGIKDDGLPNTSSNWLIDGQSIGLGLRKYSFTWSFEFRKYDD
jgi:hypothetical protein